MLLATAVVNTGNFCGFSWIASNMFRSDGEEVARICRRLNWIGQNALTVCERGEWAVISPLDCIPNPRGAQSFRSESSRSCLHMVMENPFAAGHLQWKPAAGTMLLLWEFLDYLPLVLSSIFVGVVLTLITQGFLLRWFLSLPAREEKPFKPQYDNFGLPKVRSRRFSLLGKNLCCYCCSRCNLAIHTMLLVHSESRGRIATVSQ